MSMMWTAIGTTAVGLGGTLYGVNAQKKAAQDANSKNAEAQAAQNQSAWNSYLMSRGVNPAGAATGTIPTNPQSINTKLPLWANVTRSSTGGAPRLTTTSFGATPGGVAGRSWAGLGITPRSSTPASSIASSLLA